MEADEDDPVELRQALRDDMSAALGRLQQENREFAG